MGRRNQIRQEYKKKWIYVSAIIILFCLFSFFTVFYLYNKNLEKLANESLINDYSVIDTSFSEDKGIETVVLNERNEKEPENKSIVLKNIENEVENTNENSGVNGKAEELAAVENNAQETSANPQENVVETAVDNTVKDESRNIENTVQTAVATENNNDVVSENRVLEFESPVSGEIIKDYAEETLVYSKTLDEWGTHLGIDIKANKTTIVKASEAGIVEKINTDPRYGNSITINHGNGFKTIYSSLLSSDFVKIGDQVEKGDTIGTVGDSASFEIADDAHLHFEMYKDGKQVNPTLYLK